MDRELGSGKVKGRGRGARVTYELLAALASLPLQRTVNSMAFFPRIRQAEATLPVWSGAGWPG